MPPTSASRPVPWPATDYRICASWAAPASLRPESTLPAKDSVKAATAATDSGLSSTASGNPTSTTQPPDSIRGGSPEAFPTQGESAKVIEDLLANLDSKGFFKGGKQEAQRGYAR